LAQFNPQINPTTDPSYLKFSQPISQPQEDKTLGLLFKGAGDLLTSGLKAVDFLVKDKLEKTAFSEIESEKERFTGQLEDIRTVVTGQPPASPGLMDEEKVPVDISNLNRTISNLTSSKASGQLTRTDYLSRVNQIAKSLRNQYPGYRDYIRKTINEAAGENVDNAYVTSILGEINSYISQRKSEKDQIGKELLKAAVEGMPGFDKLHDDYVNDLIDGSEAKKYLNRANRVKYEHAMAKIRREEEQGSLEDQATQAEVDATKIAFDHVTSYMNTPLIYKEMKTPRKIMELFTDVKSGKAKVSTEEARSLGEFLEQQIKIVEHTLRSKLNEPDSRGKSIVQRLTGKAGGALGVTKADSIVKAQMASLYGMRDLVYDKEYGLAYSIPNASKAITEDDILNIKKDKELNAYVRIMSVASEVGGDPFASLIAADVFNDPKFVPAVKTLMTRFLGEMGVQPDIRKDGKPKTQSEVIDEMQKIGINSPAAFDKVIDFVGDIINSESKDAVKLNAMRAAFSPNNRNLLSKFAIDDTDPNTGRRIPGKYSVLTRLTFPDVIADVARLGRKYDPSLIPNAINWAEVAFAHVFKSDIMSLKKIQMDSTMQLFWDDYNNELRLKTGPRLNLPDEDLERPYMTRQGLVSRNIDQIQKVINRLNTGFKSMANVAELSGQKPGDYVIELMLELGFDPTIGTPVNLPEHIMKVMLAGKTSQEKRKELTKELKLK